ncbi:aminotransferase class I/II-fold pyridoxal phosphate-dependent enzyme [Streptomyces sp. NPDC013178]|uniref:aminotransferase class I/II-fold pyridoxal phosphate-dependent enzyme n=1 Tax=Streptomyces sp. NPDC013178 TaxID=3155118 RepID=UPI0033FF6103
MVSPGPKETHRHLAAHWQGEEPPTVAGLLRRRLDLTPQADAYRFLTGTDGTGETWTYHELDLCARAVAVRLLRENLGGRPVLLLHPPGLDYIAAFFGCLYAGAVAVPAYPPDNARFGQTMHRLAAIARDSGATHALTTRAVREAALGSADEAAATGLDRLRWITAEEVDTDGAEAWEEPGATGDTPAFLQYTSGSTATPKGVVIGDDNLLANLRSIHLRLGHDEDAQMVSWLPPYHDMGLIGGILTPLYGGFTAHLMAPMTFVQRPLTWLETLSRTRASTSVAPNFGFELCLRRITPEQRDALDLRHWRLALNGAEPVRADTLERFADYFAPAGFDRTALLPCYGLAEATLMVTGADPHREPVVGTLDATALESGVVRDAGPGTVRTTRIVGCGTAVPDVEVAVVDTATRRRVTGDAVGEIWVSGPGVARGYRGRPEADAETFGARIDGEPGTAWLRTGDLGFQRDGELYVAGRVKDVVVVQGRNVHPHDIELTAERATDAVRPGNGAAFGVPTAEGEQLALVCELGGRPGADDPVAVLARLRAAVAEEHQVTPHTIALVKRSTVPKTTSGKLQRQAARQSFLDLRMTVVAASVVQEAEPPTAEDGALPDRAALDRLPPAERRARVTDMVRRALAESAADRDSGPEPSLAEGGGAFTDLGLDYPRLLDAVHRLERRLGVQVPVGELLVRPHTDTLVALVDSRLGDGSGTGPGRTAPGSAQIETWLTERIAARLGLPAVTVDPTQPFASLGLDSKQAVAVAGELGDWLGTPLRAGLVFDHPSVRDLAARLGTDAAPTSPAAPAFRTAAPSRDAADAARPPVEEPIAIVGMGCRFPGAPDVDSFWRLLLDGRDAVGEVPRDRWDPQAVGTPPFGGFLDRVDEFDARFFGISAREAERMDPQQRLLLETAWQTLEDAGIAPTASAGTDTGVFVGVSSHDYAQLQLPRLDAVDLYTATGNAQAVAANRLSYVLDLRGPSLAVDTACSSSLVAVHMACRSLRSGECRTALAGGVNLMLTPGLTVAFADGRMLGPGGRCRTFDDAADGYVRGEGAGLVCLKPLSAALADGDRVYAVIRGSAVGHGGRGNGLTAPRGSAQRAVMATALDRAGLGACDIGYVEAHGTGTALGDPVEWEALAEIYGRGRADGEPCLVGSVKTNIGHLEAAAGIAGLIKAALVVRHRRVPPLLHLTTPNRRLDWDGAGLAVPTRCRDLPAGSTARAGVSSFGFGGANAHLVLEAPPTLAVPEGQPVTTARPAHTLCLSAHTPTALTTLARQYRVHLAAHPDTPPASLCHAANTGRAHLPHRAALTVGTAGELDAALEALIGAEPSAAVARGHVVGGRAPTTAFLFSGQGTQYPGMGRELYEGNPGFAATLDRADAVLRPLLGTSLPDLLFDDEGGRLARTRYCQPALVALEIALAELWMSLGVRPAALLGHSVGALGAACVAGVLSLEDALTLAAERGRHMDEQPGDGAMIACVGDADVIRSTAAGFASVAVAAVNTPDHLVLSGAAEEIRALHGTLAERGVTVRPLAVSHAFHSKLMAGAAAPLLDAARGLSFHAPRIPWISDATGEPVDRVGPDYWVDHMLGTVRFADGFAALRRLGCDAFVEVGPHPTLLGLGRAMAADGADRSGAAGRAPLWLPSLRRRSGAWETLLRALGQLHCAGGEVDWAALDRHHPPERVSVPHTVFERERYWCAPAEAGTVSAAAGSAADTGASRAAAGSGPAPAPGAAQAVPSGNRAAQPTPPPPAPTAYGAPPITCGRLTAHGPDGMPYAPPGGVWPGYSLVPAPGHSHPGAVPPYFMPTPVPQPGAVSRSDVHRAVLDDLAQVCGFSVEQIPPSARLSTDLGLDSLMRTDLQRRITARFPRQAERLLNALPEDPTVQDVVDGLTGPGADAPAPWPAPSVPAAALPPPHAPSPTPQLAIEEWEEYAEHRARLRQVGTAGDNPYGRVHEGFNTGRATVNGRSVVNFAAFNYLGLSCHPRVRQAAKEAVDRYGTSSSATPLLFGETPLHHELEAEIASFLGTEAAIVFAGGHATNVATVGHLFGPEDLIVHDEWIHDSTVRGCVLAGARRRTFPHNDWEALDRILGFARARHRRALVVIEGAYSQDGDIPDLPRFVEVKRRHGTMLMIDEAHSVGVLGRTGRGIGEHFGTAPGDVDLWMGTLSKAIGSLGGYIAARGPVIEYLKYTAPLHIFSTGIAPASTAAALEALRVIRDEPERVARLRELSESFRTQARARGLDIGVSRASAIVPVITGDWQKTMALSNSLLEQGVNVMPIGYPAVARDRCRLRFFINVDHSEADLERSLDLLV